MLLKYTTILTIKLFYIRIQDQTVVNSIMFSLWEVNLFLRVDHITKFPLLGYKQVAYNKFYKKFLALRVVPKLPLIDLQEQYIKHLTQIIQLTFGSMDCYLIPYFVGFFEGTGNINIMKGRQLSSPYLYITLTHNLENECLLRLISRHIGGNVNVKSAQSKKNHMGCYK